MKILISVNFITSLLLISAMSLFSRYENLILMPVFFVLLLALASLSLGNIYAIFVFWKRHRRGAFLPILSYALAVALWFWGTPFSTRLLLAGTPDDPDSFLTIKTKAEMADIANKLLGQSFKEVRTYPGDPTVVKMISGFPQNELPSEIPRKLRALGFERTFIDDNKALVVFSHYHLRKWCDYLYSKKPLLPLYARPSELSEVDIDDWSELIRIAKQSPEAPEFSRDSISFEPSIIYSYLEEQLGRDVLKHIKTYKQASDIPNDLKKLVLAALNRQRLVDSGLVENPFFTYGEWRWHDEQRFGLCFGDSCGISDGFWVVALLKKLLEEGVLVHSADQRHLKLKQNLSEDEKRKVEWLHVGLIDFLYGNLINVREHRYQKQLGDGWYFNRS